MVGIELPVLAMEHLYLVTETMPEVIAYDGERRAGRCRMDRLRRRDLHPPGEGGMLLGTYEQASVPWSPKETPWDFGARLLEPDLDRIAPELEVAFEHFPAMATAGIKKFVNGPFTFTPDGNPLVGPIRGLRNCGSRAR